MKEKQTKDEEIIKVYRILTYNGTRSCIEATRSKSIPEIMVCGDNLIITSTWLEILPTEEGEIT